MRRPYIYPHRSVRRLAISPARLTIAALAAIGTTAAVWWLLPDVVATHNVLASRVSQLAGVDGVQQVDTIAFGRTIPALVVTGEAVRGWFSYAVAGWLTVSLILLARAVPLARGLVMFVVAILVISILGCAFGADAFAGLETFTVVWTHTELLVWLVLPTITAFLFVVLQPYPLRGLAWMALTQAFALVWAAARLVVVLGIARLTGVVLLPTLWFVWGLLADVLYITAFLSLSIYVNIALAPERRAA